MLVKTEPHFTVQPAGIVQPCITDSGKVLTTTGDLVDENLWLKDQLQTCAAKIEANRTWREEMLKLQEKAKL